MSRSAISRSAISRSRLVRLITAAVSLGAASCAPHPVPTAHPEPAITADDANAFRYEVPEPASAVALPELGVESARLKNGFGVWALPWSAQTVSLEVRCQLGATRDPPGKAGLVSLMARMLTEGTRTKTPLEQAIAFENLGTSLYHDVDSDSFGLGTEVLPDHLPNAVDELAEALLQPRFSADDFERVKKERLDTLKAVRQDPTELAWILALRATLGPTYGRPHLGSPKDINSLQQSDVETLHRSALDLKRCALLVAGSFDFPALVEHVESSFGQARALTEAAAPSPVPASPLDSDQVWFFERPGAVQSAIVIAKPFPPRKAPGFEARQVLNSLFGGLFTSRLNTNLREQNAFTYGAFSSISATRDFGLLALHTSVHSEVTQEALREAQAELQRLRDEPPLAEEIARAKADLSQRHKARLEHTSRLLLHLEDAFTHDLPANHFTGHATRVEGLSTVEIHEQLAAFSSAPFVTVVVGDDAARQALAAAGYDPKPAEAKWIE